MEVQSPWRPYRLGVNKGKVSRYLIDIFSLSNVIKYINIFTTSIHQQMWTELYDTMKPVYNDHLYNKIYYLWFIQ